MRKMLSAGVLSIGLLGVMTGTAAAAPPEPIDVTCSNGVTYQITGGQGNWAAAKVVDSNTHFLPYEFQFVVTDAAGTPVFNETVTKGGNAHQNQGPMETCTFGGTFEENGEVFTFSGTAQVIVRP